MRPLSHEKPLPWAATAEGAGGWRLEGSGPQHCLLVTKARGSKLLWGVETSDGGVPEGDPQDRV